MSPLAKQVIDVLGKEEDNNVLAEVLDFYGYLKDKKRKEEAVKFIKKQVKEVQKRIVEAIYKLLEGDIKKLKGYGKYFRLRVGDIRIIFEKENEELKIIVIDIGNRGQIYNKY